VDVSQTALDLAKQNARLNGLEQMMGFTCADVLEYLPRLRTDRALVREEGGPFDLIFNGGIFKNYPEYSDAVKAMAPKDMRIFFAEVPPVYGGAVEALYDIGIVADEAFRERFLHDYEEIKKK
jgi:tRNA G37 N-methylase Trm5